jgi:integrase
LRYVYPVQRDGHWQNARLDSQKIDKARRENGKLEGAFSFEDGLLVIYRRGEKFYARIRLPPKKYIWRSLKTRSEHLALERGRKLFLDIQFKAKYGLAIRSTRFDAALNAYLAMREESHRRGKTSAGMIRQIRRVSRFWREYAGRMLIENIGDQHLRNYLAWRSDYYARKQVLPKNAKLVPTDKTLQWELMLGKAVLRWAAQKGMRGDRPLPTFSFVPRAKRVRPAFEQEDFERLLRTLEDRIRSASCVRYTRSREMIRDYVVLLANSGIRIGEANSLRRRDVSAFIDDKGRHNFRLLVKGKTGERDVIPRVTAVPVIDRLLARSSDDAPLFQMQDGRAVTTLIDQFDAALRDANLLHNSRGERFTLYSLRHYYAVVALRSGVGVFELARNMGTSVHVIQSYYGKHATAPTFATLLGN